LAFTLSTGGKVPPTARESWTKFITYFFIIHILFFSIVINSLFFRLLALVIISVGAWELFRVYRKSGFDKKLFFLGSIVLFLMFSSGFLSVFRNREAEHPVCISCFINIRQFQPDNGSAVGKTQAVSGNQP
jgi:CDP-diglyceride synthetase